MPLSTLHNLSTANYRQGGDFKELKAMETPPDAVKMTMTALCILLDVQPEKVEKDDGKKVDDFWEPAKKEVRDGPVCTDGVFRSR